jgi:hypothetical protein
VPLVGGLRWWWRTVPANRGAAVAVASQFLYVLSGFSPQQKALCQKVLPSATKLVDNFLTTLTTFEQLFYIFLTIF